jgi:hypothetical protein
MFTLLQLVEGWSGRGDGMIATSFMGRPVSPALACAISLLPATALILTEILLHSAS